MLYYMCVYTYNIIIILHGPRTVKRVRTYIYVGTHCNNKTPRYYMVGTRNNNKIRRTERTGTRKKENIVTRRRRYCLLIRYSSWGALVFYMNVNTCNNNKPTWNATLWDLYFKILLWKYSPTISDELIWEWAKRLIILCKYWQTWSEKLNSSISCMTYTNKIKFIFKNKSNDSFEYN